MNTSKKSHAAPLTFNVVSCLGILISKVYEQITFLRLKLMRTLYPKTKDAFPPCAIFVTSAKSRVTFGSQRKLKPSKK